MGPPAGSSGSALLVAISEYEYASHYEPLKKAAQAAVELADALRQKGFDCRHPEALRGGPSKTVRDLMRNWFQEANDETRLFLYWTGHGKREGDGLYLVTQESPASNLDPGVALEPISLAKLAATSKAQKTLIVLDVCFAGEALGEMASRIANLFGAQYADPKKRRGIAVIASAHAQQPAQEGLLGRVLQDVLLRPDAARRWSDADEFIDSDRLSDAISDDLDARGSDQVIVPGGIGHKSEIVSNPRYRAGSPAEDVETVRRHLLEAGEAHFGPSSRGIEVGETGWYFCGRVRLLRDLVSWLDKSKKGLIIVTGPPGAGKSAVMGRLATLSDPVFRNTAEKLGETASAPAGTMPREGSIDVAIHAKGKTLDDCARALAGKLEIRLKAEVTVDVEALVQAAGQLGRRVTVLLDALDEAAFGHGERIAAELAVPLAKLPQVRVLVGTRRSLDGVAIPESEDRHGLLRQVFGDDAVIHDLEDERETEDDITAYVRQLLMDSRHKDNGGAIEEAAHKVARQAAGIFLYARVVSRTLQEQMTLDVSTLPATALAAFVEDLKKRFGKEEGRVDDLLNALAWTEGKGLTRRVWPVIATALTQIRKTYTDDDIAWVLGAAGWHIIETGEDGQAVYRLAHQAFTDHYRGRIEANEANRRIVAALTEGIKGAGWLDADRYLWRYLAAHAADARQLGKLIADPGYLSVAEPTRLLPALDSITAGRARSYADIYRRTVDRLHDIAPIERMPYIHLTAQMEEPDLAPSLEPPVPTRWRCRWARCRPSTPHRIIGRHKKSVTSVALGEIGGRAVVVSGSYDNTVRLWDAATGKPLGAPLTGHDNSVTSVALGEIGGRAVVVSGGYDGTVRLWDAATGKPIGAPLTGHDGLVKSVALGKIGGRAVVVARSYGGTVRLWDAATGKPLGAPKFASGDLVNSGALGLIGGRAVMVSVSEDKTVRLWDAATGKVVGELPTGFNDKVASVALGEIGGRTLVVVGSFDNALLFDLDKRESFGAPLTGVGYWFTCLALGKTCDMTLVASGCGDSVFLWDTNTGKVIGEPLQGHDNLVTTVALGEIGGRALVVSGSGDNTVRLWDATPRKHLGIQLQAHRKAVLSVGVGEVDGRTVVVSGGFDSTVRLWDANTGQSLGEALVGHRRFVTSVVLGKVGCQSVIVSAGFDQAVRLWDATTREHLRFHSSNGGPSWSVALGEANGQAMVVSGNGDNTIELWDAATGQRMGAPLKGHTSSVTSVALGEIGGRAVVVSGSRDKTVRLWDATTGKPLGAPLTGHDSEVSSIALGEIGGRAVVVSGSRDKTVRLWDATTGKPLGAPLTGHDSEVSSIALGKIGNSTSIASADASGQLRIFHWPVEDQAQLIQLAQKASSVSFAGSNSVAVALARGLVRIDFDLPRPSPEDSTGSN
jgi:WD40 repeat protein